MKIVVVGGSGFIGSHFVARAIARGHEVTVCVRSTAGGDLGEQRPYTVVTGGLERLVDEFNRYADVDVICHFASSTVPATSNADPVRDVTENLVATVRLLDAMRNGHGCKRIVYLSSGGAVYGIPNYSPIDEDHPQRPISSYGILKSAVERYLALFCTSGGLRPAIVRPANPYGPGQNPSGQVGAVPIFLGAARAGRPITVFGDGSAVRDFVYIDDLTTLLMRIVEEGTTGVFNCGGGEGGTSLTDLIEIIQLVTGQRLEVTRFPERAFDPPAIVLDNSRANALGWRPEVALEDGVGRTWRALRDAPP